MKAGVVRGGWTALCLLSLFTSLRGPVASVAAQAEEPIDGAFAIYVRQDDNATTVITPRLRAGGEVTEGTRVDLAYSIDVWTSASVDIVTAATKRVTEQRDELDVTLSQELSDLALSATYRYSNEHDYLSNGGTLQATLALAQKSSTIDVAVSALFDKVGQAGNPNFEEETSTVIARAGFTQILDPNTLVQLVYELGMLSGYLSSPYRRVSIADDDGNVSSTCVVPSASCKIEVNPDSRMRHAIALSGRRALGDAFSLGLAYRFYLDDWGINSHTAQGDVTWVPDERWLMSLGYRLYLQGAADHYKPYYPFTPTQEYYTSDKELSPIVGHRVSLEASRTFVTDDGSALRLILLVAPSHYSYTDFLRLDSITAIESTLAMELML